MHARRRIALVSLLIGVAVSAGLLLRPKGGPVDVAFVRYETVGTDLYAYMQIRNNSSRPISYHSTGVICFVRVARKTKRLLISPRSGTDPRCHCDCARRVP